MSEECVIQIVGLVNNISTGFDGQYLVEYDPTRNGEDPLTGVPMMCYLKTTPDLDEATVYPNAAEAIKVWQLVDPLHPTRPDGRPNRPLTAFSVGLMNLEDQRKVEAEERK